MRIQSGCKMTSSLTFLKGLTIQKTINKRTQTLIKQVIKGIKMALSRCAFARITPPRRWKIQTKIKIHWQKGKKKRLIGLESNTKANKDKIVCQLRGHLNHHLVNTISWRTTNLLLHQKKGEKGNINYSIETYLPYWWLRVSGKVCDKSYT